MRMLLIAVLLALPLIAQARWATPQDVESEVLFRNDDVVVEGDGSYTETIEEEIRIMRESGRTNRGIARFSYNSDSSRLDVTEAYTLNGKKRIPVPRHLIENKPLASSGSGFDQHHQVMIAFPEVNVGSRLHTKIRIKHSRVPVPKFYSDVVDLSAEYLQALRVTLRSALPLELDVQDSEGYLDIKRQEVAGDRHPHQVDLVLKRPIYKQAIDEENVLLNPSRYPLVWIATSKDWADTAPPSVIADYEKVVSAPLPAVYQEIAARAGKEKDTIAKANTVIAGLAEAVRYLGDWRSIRGRFVPRPLAKVAETRYGDCKDFAASTTAILRKLGLDAHVAWVKRGRGPVLESYALPASFLFNHAIVHLNADGREYWLDPTNVAAFAQGTPRDISDRPAFVLDPARPRLGRIPADQPDGSRHLTVREIAFGAEGSDPKVSGTYHADGAAAAQWIFWYYSSPQETIDRRLAFNMARSDQIRDWKVEGFRLQHRIVQPLDANFAYTENRAGYPTSAGIAYPLPNLDALDRLLTPVENRVSDLYLDQPYTTERDTILRGIEPVGSESLDCAVESAWVSAKREVTRVPAGVRVRDQLVVKQPLILNAELLKPEFGELQKKVRACFRNSALVYRLKPASKN